MRTFCYHSGPCEFCGHHAAGGAYWITVYRVLDFGISEAGPVEPDRTDPVLCDDCELLRRLYCEPGCREAMPAAR